MMSSSMGDAYREQIQRCARALAAVKPAEVAGDIDAGDIDAGDVIEHVKMFTDGNCEKRFEKARDQVEFIKAAFENLDDLVAEYIFSESLVAYDTGCSDGERFLDWLVRAKNPTPEQSDYITCQRSRHGVENLARNRRMAHVRFQELWSIADRLIDELQSNRGIHIYLNPIRRWTTFQTNALLDKEATTQPRAVCSGRRNYRSAPNIRKKFQNKHASRAPANVLFYACEDQIRTAVLELSGQALIRVLEKCDRCTLDAWLALAPEADEHQLVDLCHEGAEMGLLAFG